ncbi:MAG: hypothetical protein ACPG6P_04670, partial [Akkermansiaceae bacterium]
RAAKAKGIVSHEADGKFTFFDLSPYAQHFKVGKNTICIEGHNTNINSTDFTLHPTLLVKTK